MQRLTLLILLLWFVMSCSKAALAQAYGDSPQYSQPMQAPPDNNYPTQDYYQSNQTAGYAPPSNDSTGNNYQPQYSQPLQVTTDNNYPPQNYYQSNQAAGYSQPSNYSTGNNNQSQYSQQSGNQSSNTTNVNVANPTQTPNQQNGQQQAQAMPYQNGYSLKRGAKLSLCRMLGTGARVGSRYMRRMGYPLSAIANSGLSGLMGGSGYGYGTSGYYGSNGYGSYGTNGYGTTGYGYGTNGYGASGYGTNGYGPSLGTYSNSLYGYNVH